VKRALICTLVALFLSLCVAAAPQADGTLKGKIVDEKGKPIVDADVRVMRSRDRSVKETRTDQSGSYLFQLQPDEYAVSFDAQGFQGGTLVQMQQVEEGKETQVKTIRLKKARRTSLLRGAVFDQDGRSLAGVHLKLVRVAGPDEKDPKKIKPVTRDYVTNARGEFAFRLPSQRARYQVTALLTGYQPETKTVDVQADEAVPMAFSLQPVKR
jgi:carboxypeptidase family protein